MHEVAIIRDILQTLEAHHGDKLDRITKVQIEAGLLCNVQPILIQNAFEAMRIEEPKLAELDLEVKLLPVIAFCKSCNKEFPVQLNRFVCECGAPSNTIIQGEELRISKVEFIND
ncbi:hydrogenase maturation nickel metallochaperone HypA [Pseudoflavitalea sp. G-6-1-2]|uniref:hydrogenase maturation nickel metallochaperone HypA/HybF n=1 Tax=Pseudoflavitalea sp. G-6-1-2 TaxID=2728841 RepID=UPI00146CDB72|nr:hydrogenase maturation nickel metallochaperone HypA [Pseudoflavitalea sp. G-6-1-2]NML20846.1 hydrogenase maturation nickel metallochaperone HypA [Pseudoflavitalea sp. G-6-1-2]